MIAAREIDDILDLIRPYTVIPEQALRIIWGCAKRTEDLEGDVAELGVYEGGSTMLIALACPGKVVHAFDTFTGIHNIGPEDKIRRKPDQAGHANGDFTVSDVTTVRRRLEAYGVKIHIGPFAEMSSRVADRRFCFSHCDADTFSSTMEFLDFFYPRTVRSGYMLFDDYRWPSTPGVDKAIGKYLAGKPEVPEVVGPYQCVIVRR